MKQVGCIKYIGRTTDFCGNTLWELIGSRRDLGIGRLVYRNMFQRYDAPCCYRILGVQHVDDQVDGIKRVNVSVRKTWRGNISPKTISIFSASYKPDYFLVPKDEEDKYIGNIATTEKKVVAKNIDFPPLLREFISDEIGRNKLKVVLGTDKSLGLNDTSEVTKLETPM